MREKFLKALGAALILFLFVVGVLFAARMVFWSKDDPGLRLLLDQKNKEIDDKERQIEALESQIVQLRAELGESSKRISELEAKVEQAARELSSAHEKLKSVRREAERLAAKPTPPVEKATPRPPEPAPSTVWRRPAEPGIYETLRATAVFAEPSAASRKVASISRGVRVTVVGSVGEWLEIRSKHGNPPGFIRRDDAMFVEK